MANLKIYSDITDQEGKAFLSWMGVDGVDFTDVARFVEELPEGEDINLDINCRGGLISEAWAMYDTLRATGRKITAEVVGECSSAATILLLAAAKGERRSHPNATFLFHYPYVDGIFEPMRADDVEKLGRALTKEGQRLVSLYVERTGVDAETIESLMAEDRSITADEAKNLGFIDEIIAPMSAHHNNRKMAKSKVMKAFKALGRLLGDVYGMSLETADGKTLELVKEAGEPTVGDEVMSEDGEYLMPDGNTIVVVDGVISEIRPAEPVAEPEEEPAEEEVEEEPEPSEEPTEKEDKTAELESKIAELEKRIAELEAKLAESEADAKSDEDKEILNAVAAAGGRSALKALKSNGTVPKRERSFKGEGMSFAEYHNNAKK